MRRYFRVVGTMLLLLACLIGAVVAFGANQVRKDLRDKAAASKQHHLDELERYRERYEADQLALASLTELSHPWTGKDASELLGPLVPWTRSPRTEAFVDQFEAEHGKPKLQVSKALHEALRVPLREEPMLAGLEKPDLSWMKQLRDYDHWNLGRNSPNELLAPKTGEDLMLVFAQPTPQYLALRDAARLRMETASEDELTDAAAEVHQLAVLMWRTDMMIEEGDAVTLFALERRVLERRGAAQKAHPFSQETNERLERVAWGALAYTYPWTPPAVRDRLMQPSLQLGACASVREASQAELILRPMVEDQYAETYRWLDDQFDGGVCDLTGERAFYELTHRSEPPGYCDAFAVDTSTNHGARSRSNLISRLVCSRPLRPMLAEQLLALDRVDAFKHYRPDGGR